MSKSSGADPDRGATRAVVIAWLSGTPASGNIMPSGLLAFSLIRVFFRHYRFLQPLFQSLEKSWAPSQRSEPKKRWAGMISIISTTRIRYSPAFPPRSTDAQGRRSIHIRRACFWPSIHKDVFAIRPFRVWRSRRVWCGQPRSR